MSKQYYVEKRAFGNTLYREVVEGTNEMLNAYPEKNALVEIRNLDIVYGSGAKSFPAIKDLNLNIYDGEVLGLVGESGSGKSTTGRAIIGLTPYEFGQIKILDRIVPKNIDKGWKFSKKYKDTINFMVNKVQMIFQDPTNSLNPFKNVEYVVGEGLSNTKNAKLIYLTDFDEATFMAINSLIQLKDPENIIYDSPLNKYQEEGETIESSYNFVFVEFVKLLEQKASDNPEIYNDIYKKILVEKEERDKMSSLSEKQCKKLLVIDILKQVGLDDTVLGRFPLEFSGGQQQRLGICRAVVLRPKLLIADEPISALDVSIQAQVINIFNDLKEKYHLTILFIAHDLRMVEYISDRIAVINRGTLLEIGPTDEIINNPYHPYTKSLLDAVPSIEKEKGSLMGKVYDHKVHNYTEEYQPKWHNVGNNHFVLATAAEIEQYRLESVTKERQ